MVEHTPTQQEARHVRRVELRPDADADLERWRAAWSGHRPASSEDLRPAHGDRHDALSFERLRRTHTHLAQLDRAHVLAAFETATQACIGEITLTVLARAHVQWADLGFGLFTPAQGQGLGPPLVQAAVAYACDTLALHRVEAVVLPENTRSRATLTHAGFEHEGVRRAFHLNDGVWTDMVVYVWIRQNREN
jgi:RimJ/RimL family protein N-acetyltransferase